MNVPKLRFGGFIEAWKCKNLGDIAQFSKGKGIAKADISKDGQFECIRYGELYTHYKETIKQVISRTNLSADELVFSDANDVIIPASGETQLDIATASCVLKKGVALGGDLNIIKSDANGVFLSYYLNNAKKQSIANLAQGISVVHLYASQLKTLELNIPEIEEQQKIADFFSAVDEKITALTAQKTALTQYKQGMMQRIFAQTLRFKDDNGADYPEWDSMRLEELGEFKSGVGFSESEQGGQEGIPFFKVSDMNLSENTFHMNIANHYVTEEQIQKLKLKVIKKDAIIFAKVGAAIFLERKRIAKNFLIDNNMMAFIPKANLLFMKYLFETVQLSKFAQVGALPSYNSSDLGIIKVGLPNSYEEQTKIARFLTECDDKINAVDAQIQSAQQWKQGLLQQMFI